VNYKKCAWHSNTHTQTFFSKAILLQDFPASWMASTDLTVARQQSLLRSLHHQQQKKQIVDHFIRKTRNILCFSTTITTILQYFVAKKRRIHVRFVESSLISKHDHNACHVVMLRIPVYLFPTDCNVAHYR